MLALVIPLGKVRIPGLGVDNTLPDTGEDIELPTVPPTFPTHPWVPPGGGVPVQLPVLPTQRPDNALPVPPEGVPAYIPGFGWVWIPAPGSAPQPK